MSEPTPTPAAEQFRWRGEVYDYARKILVPEVAIYERQAGRGLRQMTSTEAIYVVYLVSLRRAGVVLSWQDAMTGLPLEEFEDVQREIPDDDTTDDDGGQAETLDPTGAGSPPAPAAPQPEQDPAPLTTSQTATG